MERIRTDIMGMPIRVVVCGVTDETPFNKVFSLLESIDERFSTYKDTSEISRINRGEVSGVDYSQEMQEVLALAEQTRTQTDGYFDVHAPTGAIDPSGVVKGWALQKGVDVLVRNGQTDFLIDIAGDVATRGMNEKGEPWSVGIRNPFNRSEIVKVIYPRGRGVATSGLYERGAHIYNPHDTKDSLSNLASITVVAPTILEADLLATASFAMGEQGIEFLERTPNVEGYAIHAKGVATMTSGFTSLTQI